jgi:SNF2 family DNA or RNA helicase
MRFLIDLHQYQLHAIEFIKREKRCLLAISMGLGKTISTLTAVNDLIDSFTIHKTLIIAPLRVANSVWTQEAALWEHTKHLKVSVCTGTERQRLTALMQDADIFVINRENVEWLVKSQKKWRFDCVVVDESDSFKNASSKRFRALRKVLPDTTHMVLLSGTPSPNGLLDIWAQMYLIDFGERLGRTMTSYKDRFFEKDYMGYNFTLREGSAGKIHDLLRDKVLSMSSEDYLELPDRISLVEAVDLPPATLRDYKDFETTLLATLPDGEEIEAMNAAVLAGKLLQWCLAEGTEVLTISGWKPIETITKYDLLWDGIEWANCFGIVCNGYKNTIELDGVHMTTDHQILTVSGWHTAEDIVNGYADKRFKREKVWDVDGDMPPWVKPKQKCNMAMSMRLWAGSCSYWFKSYWNKLQTLPKIMWVQSSVNNNSIKEWARDVKNKTFSHLVKRKIKVQQSKRQGFQKLWGPRNKNVHFMGKFVFNFLGRYACWLFRQFNIGSNRQQFWLLQRQLSMGKYYRPKQQYQTECQNINTLRENEYCSGSKSIWNKTWDATCAGTTVWVDRRKAFSNTKKVYDILNVGTKNRFVIRGKNGELLISHNCNGAIYTDEHHNWSELHDVKLDALAEIIENNSGENILVAYNFKHDLARLQQRFPSGIVLDKDPSTITRWQQGKIKLLFAHPQSAGHGINLQDGGCLAVWFGLTWSLGHYQQFNARLHRQGQQRPVRIIHIIASDTIDERVVSVLTLKGAIQNNLLNALKRSK